MGTQSGQSLVETCFLTILIAVGTLGIWNLCREGIARFVDLILAVIASPVP